MCKHCLEIIDNHNGVCEAKIYVQDAKDVAREAMGVARKASEKFDALEGDFNDIREFALANHD
jgi:hypothetical protein